MSTQHISAALMSALPLPEMGTEPKAPEWIQILPATQGVLETYDGRGPYRVDDIDALIATSFARSRRGRIPIDQDHAIAKAAPQGNPAPARGWITEMQARDDGLYGKVTWTKAGAEMVADGAYESVSPVLMHTTDKRVVFIREVSLVNRQNLRGMAALQSEENSAMLKKLIEMLGLGEDATEDQVMSALKSKMEAKPAAQSEDLGRVAKAAGLAEDAKADDIVAAVQSAIEVSTGEERLITALQAEVDVLKKDGKRRDAEAAVSEARAKGKGIGKATEKVLVSLHMEGNMDAFNEMVAAQSDLSATHTSDTAPNLDSATMSAEEISDKASAYMAKCEAEGRMITAAQAVDHVMEASQ